VNRALRAATTVVLLVSPVALSACSAGQVTQTATQERDKVGAMAQVGGITLRAVELENPRGGSYERGDDAGLRMAIVNGGEEADTLVGISGDGFGDVEIEGGSSSGEVEIPAGGAVFLGGDADASVTLTELDGALSTGQFLELTFEFENAGDITVPVTVSTPEKAQERGEAFDFHQEEHGEEEQGREGGH
jgi:copper(I)-binding protein